MFMTADDNGIHVDNIFVEYPDATHIKMTQFKDMFTYQSTPTDVTTAMSVDVKGIKITER
ncbi:hypothetical protein IMAU10418_03033 [Lactiplantibacillus plantarum]|nr:hypothetical protein [Lactiplantibacillus plantarum]